MHAAGQDMEVLDRACGAAPTRLFDTQVAAGFLGFSSPALGTLVARVLGLTLPKADRLTDWLRRPLRPEQLTYAAADVAHLLELHALLAAELATLGRLAWAEEECELLRRKGLERPAPEEAWLKLKDLRHVRGRGRGVAQEVAAWRDRRAAATDQPVRHVLPDLAIVGIATRPPATVQELRAVRGLDDRHLRGGAAEGILEAVERGLHLAESELRTARRDDLDRTNRPAVALAGAWLAQLGRDVRIDPTLLATRADLAALVAGDADARLQHGWRGEVLGAPLRQLLAGDAALAFEGDGRLVLEERSGRVLAIDLAVPDVGWA